MTGPSQVRTYGGWRRSRGIGLLGLGPAATMALLGSAAALIVVAAVSARALVYVAPPVAAAWAAGLVKVGGVPVALVVVKHARWWHGTRAGYTRYQAQAVREHLGVLQLPGPLAATELLSADDGSGGRFGLVRDRHTGYLTATLRAAAVSTWLADTGDVDRWVANWAGWLASLGHLPAVRWATVTIATAPDHGSTLTDQVTAALAPDAPPAAVEIIRQVVASAPAAAAEVDTRVSITFDPTASAAQPRTMTEAVTDVSQILAGLETALGACGVHVLGRPRATDIAAMIRSAYDPAVRGEVTRVLARASPDMAERPDWAAAGPAAAEERSGGYAHDSGLSVSWAWREAPRQHVTADILARLTGPGRYPKRVSLQYRPLPATTAAAVLDQQVRAAEFRREYQRRTRRDVTARDLHDHARARQAADEEAQGAGVSPLAMYVTVTVTDPGQLPRAIADTEAAAEASKIRLQRLDGSHAAAFTATLPCGICLPDLARRLRH